MKMNCEYNFWLRGVFVTLLKFKILKIIPKIKLSKVKWIWCQARQFKWTNLLKNSPATSQITWLYLNESDLVEKNIEEFKFENLITL